MVAVEQFAAFSYGGPLILATSPSQTLIVSIAQSELPIASTVVFGRWLSLVHQI